ncbi:MAG: Crp/Fnr family transcriptional regulator [Sphingobium sp.]|uniref:Crp/Fnr family transcriptional regulator n=1 Tax=Sphingobium sp. TaxID=1912891 RepID=UPI003BAFE73A
MTVPPHPLHPLIARLGGRIDLSDTDRAALSALPFQVRAVGVGAYVVQEGERASACQILLSGYTHRHRFSAEGVRHIVGIHGEGDILNLPVLPPQAAEDAVQAITPTQVAAVPIESILGISRTHPRVAQALWAEVDAQMSIVRAWISNMGRRDARGRLAHLFCELALRHGPIDEVEEWVISPSLTQTVLADATGVTTVHVNRTLRALEAEGYIRRDRRRIMIADRQRLAQLADFNRLRWATAPDASAPSAG